MLNIKYIQKSKATSQKKNTHTKSRIFYLSEISKISIVNIFFFSFSLIEYLFQTKKKMIPNENKTLDLSSMKSDSKMQSTLLHTEFAKF